MKMTVCPVCGEGSVKKEVIKETFTYKGHSIEVDNYVVWRCNNCGEAIVDPETSRKVDKILVDFKRKVDGLLTSEEIKKIRKKLNLSQEEMGKILGGGKKSFARYETGKICQSKAMDNLLRILNRYPFVLSVLMPKKGYYHIKEKQKLSRLENKIVYIDEYRSKIVYNNNQDKDNEQSITNYV